MQQRSGNTHWREDKFPTMHNSPPLPLPCRGISKPACQKEEPVVEILPELTMLHKAYLDEKEGGENIAWLTGLSVSHPPTSPKLFFNFLPVQHHLHVVPHVRVPILIDGEASRGVEQLDMHDSNLRRERSKLNDEGRGRKQNNIQVLFNS